MNAKVLSFLLAGGLVALAAWLVHLNSTPEYGSPNGFAPIAHGAGPKPGQAVDVPEKYRDTVYKGLEYLVKNQHKDGHWEGDAGKHPVAMTALVGMALLMENNSLEKGKYSANIRKAVDWLVDKSEAGREGPIFSGHPSESDRYMYGHGLATQFLAWAHRSDSDEKARKKLDDVLIRAAKYIAKAQSTQGGWYKTSKVEGHDFAEVSATVIQIQALYIAGNRGIPVRNEAVVGDAQEYLKKVLAKNEEGAKQVSNRSKPAETAAALACRCCPDAFLNQDGLGAKWFKECRTEIPVGRDIKFGRDELTHYYYAQAVFNLMLNPEFIPRSDAIAWSDYRTAMFDHLQNSQNKDGSWPSGDGISVGPVYSTAVWCTILQLDKKMHPLTRTRVLNTF